MEREDQAMTSAAILDEASQPDREKRDELDASAVEPVRENPGVTPGATAVVPSTPSAVLLSCYVLAGIVITFTVGLGQNFLSTNLQQVAGPMGLTQQEATWLLAAYYFPNASVTLILFKMRTQFGLRNFAEASVVVHLIVSGSHFWIDTYTSSLVVAFFAGAAAAPLTSLGFLYILEKFPPSLKMNAGLCAALTASALATPLTGIVSPSLLDLRDYRGFNVAEVGLSLLSLALIYLLPLASPPRAKIITTLDLISYVFLAIAMGSFAVVLTVGKSYWWTAADWIGWLTVAGILSGAVFAAIELNRSNHLVDIRWLTSREILHFAGVLIVFRMAFSEQISGAVAFLRSVGVATDQLTGLYWVMFFGGLAAGVLAAFLVKANRHTMIHVTSLLMIATASYFDSQATVLTRPEQMYVSQFLMSAASGLFLPSALAVGFGGAIKRGFPYILSFIVVFLATQKIGGFLGSAVYGTFVQWREQFHSARLVERLSSVDPQVAARLKQLAGTYGRVLTDPAEQAVQGAGLLARQVQQQAYTLAYNDSFLLTSCLAVLALVALLVHVVWRDLTFVRPAEAPSPVIP